MVPAHGELTRSRRGVSLETLLLGCDHGKVQGQWEQETGALIRKVSLPVTETLKPIGVYWAEGEKGVGRGQRGEAGVRWSSAPIGPESQGRRSRWPGLRARGRNFKDLRFYANDTGESLRVLGMMGRDQTWVLNRWLDCPVEDVLEGRRMDAESSQEAPQGPGGRCWRFCLRAGVWGEERTFLCLPFSPTVLLTTHFWNGNWSQ